MKNKNSIPIEKMEDYEENHEFVNLPKGFHIVDHIDGGKCLLDTNTYEYYLLPEFTNKGLVGNKLFNYFDTIREYLESDVSKAMIPVFCNGRKKDKKRFIVTILSGNDTYDIYNVEMIAGYWTHNEIDSMIKMNAYFIFIEKHNDAGNDFLIRSSKLINRNSI